MVGPGLELSRVNFPERDDANSAGPFGDGRAVGAKQLTEYLEVRGYADAAQWVYRQGLTPGNWTTGELITLTEERHVHTLAMSKVVGGGAAPRRDRPGEARRVSSSRDQALPGRHAATRLA